MTDTTMPDNHFGRLTQAAQGADVGIWEAVNAHLGTNAKSFPDLVEQLGVMRFGRRPYVADTFCGSGQIPFEAARLGCDVFASDLNPVACLLTWGAFNIVGGTRASRAKLASDQQDLVRRVQEEIDQLGVETDTRGWRAKVFLYCVETRCPQTGWMVPLLPTRVVSRGYRVVTELVPDATNRRYDIQIRTGVSVADMDAAETGTIDREGTYGEACLIHNVGGVTYKTKISTLRGGALSIKLCLKGGSSSLLKARLKHGIKLSESRSYGSGDGSPSTVL